MEQVLSWHRLLAVIIKEFIQLRRDRLTFAMMVGIPLIQLVLFGYAINGDPKHLPTVVVTHEQTPFTRAIVQSLENSGYFQLVAANLGDAEADKWLEQGDAQFAVIVPAGFSKKLQRGERPQLLVAADATDPSATANAIGALQQLSQQWLQHELSGPLNILQGKAQPYELVIQRCFNPEGLTQYNIVPGLMGVILTMTMIMMTALAVTREVERGTMENLLATPVRPLEVMLGKILPYVLIGFVQVGVILAAAELLFEVPFIGSVSWLLLGVLIFILLLFNPVTFTWQLTRVLRDGLYPGLALLVTGSAIGLFVRRHESARSLIGWAVTCGLATAAFWTASEGCLMYCRARPFIWTARSCISSDGFSMRSIT